MLNPDGPILPDQVIPIVVGSHLRAEVGDRPRGAAVCEAIEQWKEKHDINKSPYPLVCSDLWYLNQIELRIQPTICIGSPEVNAATAAISGDLQTLCQQADEYRIQGDAAFVDLKCAFWGIDEKHADQCVKVFVKDVLPQWLGSFYGISIEI